VSYQDSLTPEAVVTGLMSRVFGRRDYFYYREIDSTNNRALELAADGYPEGTVVVAETQTAGRGRRGRTWYSPPRHGLYLSVILRPQLPVREIPRVSLVIGVAVAETLEAAFQLPARIKWPNDILINNRKIAGVLSEVVTGSRGIDCIVTGIGLNINNPLQDFPGELRTAPTSVLAEKETPVSRVRVLQELLMHLETRYYQLLEGNFNGILDKGKSLSTVIGKEVEYDSQNGLAIGQAVDIDDNGFLLVKDKSGKIHTVTSGEVYLSSPREGGKGD
jgi:BirA family biotin operon repressor/biotin-[acetyl-CoA-carboxylase] ligase